ncbi:hypothetical protein D3C85_1493790 [compost metagenome]
MAGIIGFYRDFTVKLYAVNIIKMFDVRWQMDQLPIPSFFNHRWFRNQLVGYHLPFSVKVKVFKSMFNVNWPGLTIQT